MCHSRIEAFIAECWINKVGTRPEHIRDVRMDGTVHKNKMERMNGELREESEL
ncbi:MAG: hypothetical protein ACLP5V_04730 [Candidatus Bathyarchaeia archaeon]